MSLKTPPGPSASEFLMYFPGLLYDPLNTLNRICKNYGSFVRLGFGNDTVYLVNDASALKEILKSDYLRFPRGKTLDDVRFLLGKGLFAADHEIWSSQRKLIKPAFHSEAFPLLEKVIREELTALREQLDRFAATGKSFDFERMMKRLMFRITVRNLFSGDIKADPDEIIEALDIITGYASFGSHTMTIIKKTLYSSLGKKYRTPAKILRAGQVIEDLVNRILNNVYNYPEQCGTFLNILINEAQAGRIPRRQVVDEMKNIIFAGFDTTAEALTWSFFSIFNHPGILMKTREEVEGKEPPDHKNVFRLPYTQNVVKETLRLFPPAWAFHRITTAESVLSGYTLPVNSWLFISPWLIHRSSLFWDNPEEFNPGRFNDEERSQGIRFEYIPFGNGPHVCIGNGIANFELLYMIASLVPEYNFTFADKKPPRLVSGIIIRSSKPVMAQVRKV